MGCNCNGNCKDYGKPGCLCALRDNLKRAQSEYVEEPGADKPD